MPFCKLQAAFFCHLATLPHSPDLWNAALSEVFPEKSLLVANECCGSVSQIIGSPSPLQPWCLRRDFVLWPFLYSSSLINLQQFFRYFVNKNKLLCCNAQCRHSMCLLLLLAHFYLILCSTSGHSTQLNTKLFLRSSLSCFVFSWWNMLQSVQWWTAVIHLRAAGSLVHMLLWFLELSDSIMNICPYRHPSPLWLFSIYLWIFPESHCILEPHSVCTQNMFNQQ